MMNHETKKKEKKEWETRNKKNIRLRKRVGELQEKEMQLTPSPSVERVLFIGMEPYFATMGFLWAGWAWGVGFSP